MPKPYKILHGAPPPKVVHRRKQDRRMYRLDLMVVDSYILVPHKKVRTVSTYVSRLARKLDGKFTCRHVWMALDANGDYKLAEAGDKGAIEGVGIWRVE